MDSATVPPEVRGLASASGGGAAAGDGYGAVTASKDPSRKRLSLPPLTGRNSTVITAGIIIADLVGAGILSLGMAVAKFGWLLGAVMMVLLLAVNVHTSLLLWRLKMGFPSAYTYLDLSSAAFSLAPEWQRRLAERMTLTAQQLHIFLGRGLYSLTIGRSLGELFYSELHLCLPWLVFLGLLGFLPVFIYARSMGTSRFLIALNVLTILGSVIIPLVYMAVAGVAETRLPGGTVRAVEDFSVTSELSGLGVVCFSFASQVMLVEIMAEMREPAEFPQAYMISTPFQLIMYLVAGVGAYWYMGSRASGILMDNLPFGPTLRVASACLLVHMLIAFLIKGVVFNRWAQQTWNASGLNDTSLSGWLGWAATVTVGTGLSWFAAQLVPFFAELVDLMGATTVPLLSYVFPILMYLRWLHDTGNLASVGPWEVCALALEACLAVLCLSFGTYHAMVTILGRWDTFGMPFSCHCENMWATCACSSHHPGMEQCVAAGPR